METNVLREIRKLQQMSVGELREHWLRLYGQPTRSRNRQFLFRRLAWRLQELQLGGLSARAQGRIDELAPEGLPRVRTPKNATLATASKPEPPPAKVRDISAPAAGTVISKLYKGHELRVVVRDDGLEYDGRMFPSLTAIAKAVTGSKSINGRLFFGLSTRKR